MNTDVIREAAEERYLKQKEGVPFLCDSSDVSMFQREAFIEGYQLGAARERERMMKFAEWIGSSGIAYWKEHKCWIVLFSRVNDKDEKTTSELLEIFNQENKEG